MRNEAKVNKVRNALRSFFEPLMRQVEKKSVTTDPGNIIIAIAIYFLAEAILASAESITYAIKSSKE